jgi:hypothetical protein
MKANINIKIGCAALNHKKRKTNGAKHKLATNSYIGADARTIVVAD